MHMWSARTVAVLLCSVLLAVGCDDDGDGGTAPENGDTPEVWQGVWEQTTTTSACGDAPRLRQATSVDTILICPERVYMFEQFEDFADECTETWNGRTLRLTCTGTTSFSGCTVGFSAEVEAALAPDGQSYSFTGFYDITTSLECGDLFDRTCEELDGDAVRVSDSIADCDGAEPPPLGEFSLTIDDTDGQPMLRLDERVVQVAQTTGGAWTIAGRNFPPGPTQSVVLTVPDDVAVGTPVPLTLGDEEQGATFVYTEERDEKQWAMVGFDGTLTLDRADDEKIVGSLGGAGAMRDAPGSPVDSVQVSGAFDLRVDTVVPPLRQAVVDRIRGAVHRAVVDR